MAAIRTALGGLLGLAACVFDSAGVGGEATQGSETGTSTLDATTTAPTTTTTTTTTTTPTTTAPLDTSGETTASSVATTIEPTGSESSSGGGSESSTGAEQPPPFGPFDDAVPVDELNDPDAYDDDPSLRFDLLEIYFASTRALGQGGEEIWRAQRGAVDEPWDPPTLVTELNSSNQDGWPELSHDGLVITFGSDRGGGEGSFDVYLAIRNDVDDGWDAPMNVAALSTNVSEGAAALSNDQLEVFLASPLATANDDIASATRDMLTDMFAAATPVAELNTGFRDTVPFLDVGGTRLLFASDRPGTAGTMDIWTAVRDPGLPFDDPVQVADVNSAGADDDPWWAPDGSVLYFARSGPGGALDIYMAPLLVR